MPLETSSNEPIVLRAPLPPAPALGDGRTAALDQAFERLLGDLGYETASLYVRDGRGWKLLRRNGPEQPWHMVMDPTALGSSGQPCQFRDARLVPGVGRRLAEMGCASIAALPAGDGATLILDSSKPSLSDGWIERAKPYVAILSIMSGPEWGSGPSLRNQQEIAILQSVFSSCQNVLGKPRGQLGELLEAAKRDLHADQLFLLSGADAGIEIHSAPPGNWPRRLARDAQVVLAGADETAFHDQAIRTISMALGISTPTVQAAAGRTDGHIEVLVCGWSNEAPLSSTSMKLAARAVSTAAGALQGRQRAVSTLIDSERTKMAFALHDGLTQTVTSAVLELEALRGRIEEDPAAAAATLDSAKSEIRRALSELRAILFDLTDGPGEPKRPEGLTHSVEDVVKRWRLPARVSVDGDLNVVPGRILSVAYVVIRESLANAAKHASSSSVTVSLAVGESDFVVAIGDRGRGFTKSDHEVARSNHHVGLGMLRRRVSEVGGNLKIETAPGKGTRVVARLPMREVTT